LADAVKEEWGDVKTPPLLSGGIFRGERVIEGEPGREKKKTRGESVDLM